MKTIILTLAAALTMSLSSASALSVINPNQPPPTNPGKTGVNNGRQVNIPGKRTNNGSSPGQQNGNRRQNNGRGLQPRINAQ